jgi:hypothetical protein
MVENSWEASMHHTARAVLLVLIAAFGAGPLMLAPVAAQVTGLPYKPPSPDPRNIMGAYQPQGEGQMFQLDGSLPPFKPEGRAILDRRVKLAEAGTPEAGPNTSCLPHGTPRILLSSFPVFIYQVPGEVLFVHETQHIIRTVYMDEEHPKDLDPTFMGHHVGRWEGDTLVVDTVAMNDKTSWLDQPGTPHGDQLHVIERWKKISDGKQLEVLITIDDPQYYTKPWTTRRVFDWSPNIRMMEYVCEENNRNPPGADGTTTVQPATN